MEPIEQQQQQQQQQAQATPIDDDALPPDAGWRFIVTTLLIICGIICLFFVTVNLALLFWAGAYAVTARIPFPGMGKRDKNAESQQ